MGVKIFAATTRDHSRPLATVYVRTPLAEHAADTSTEGSATKAASYLPFEEGTSTVSSTTIGIGSEKALLL